MRAHTMMVAALGLAASVTVAAQGTSEALQRPMAGDALTPSMASMSAAGGRHETFFRGETTVGLSTAQERLSNRTPDWRESSLQLRHAFSKRQVLDLVVSDVRRFGLRDDQIGATYVTPLNDSVTATFDGNLSSTHRVLARRALGAALQYEFAPAWLLHGGVRQTRYDAVTVNQAIAMVEHYFGNYSVSAAWRPSRAFGTTAHSGEIRLSHYYSDRDSISVSLASGQEAANIGATVVLSDVRSLVLLGRHWLNDHWAVTYAAGHTRQGDFYTRKGINLGVQYAF